jgi:outer membrane protein assembly factor BamB
MVISYGTSTSFLVPTRSGTVHLVAADGTEIWSGTLAVGQALGEGNVHSPAAAPFGTAYLTSADGRLHAVIVDGHLDTSAPWPKAWHDPRNTGNAASGF